MMITWLSNNKVDAICGVVSVRLAVLYYQGVRNSQLVRDLTFGQDLASISAISEKIPSINLDILQDFS